MQLKVTTYWLLPRGSVKKYGPPRKTAEGSVMEIAGKELIGILQLDMRLSSEREIILAIQYL